MHRDKAPKIVRLWITWWTMWITCRKKCGQSRCIPCIKATGSHFVHPLARREEGLFFCSFSFCERKRTKKKAQESAPAIPPRPPVSETYLPRKKYFAGLFFRSFSFCERKRTKKKAQESAPAIPPRPPVSGACLPRKNICGAFQRKAPQGKMGNG